MFSISVFVHWNNKHLHLIFKKVKIKYSKKVRSRDKGIVALCVDKDKCLGYEISSDGDFVGNLYLCIHDSRDLIPLEHRKNSTFMILDVREYHF